MKFFENQKRNLHYNKEPATPCRAEYCTAWRCCLNRGNRIRRSFGRGDAKKIWGSADNFIDLRC